jgi:hypothetical protein
MSTNETPTAPNPTVHPSVMLDSDQVETQEWLESLDALLRFGGPLRCKEVLHRLNERARSLDLLEVSTLLNTPYRNTIACSDEPLYPGDLELERRIIAIVRWNALAMVVRANQQSSELGGHLSSYASAADLFEVGFNHFFRGDALEQATERTAEARAPVQGTHYPPQEKTERAGGDHRVLHGLRGLAGVRRVLPGGRRRLHVLGPG